MRSRFTRAGSRLGGLPLELALALALSIPSGCITGKDPVHGQDGGGKADQKVNPPGDGTGPVTDGKPHDGKPKQDSPKTSDGGSPVPGTFVTIAKTSTPFSMGAQYQEYCANTVREQLHQVTLTHSFLVGKTEVTQEEYEQVMGKNPSTFTSTDSSKASYCGQASCKKNPVEGISWPMAAEYANKLSALAGKDPCYTCTGSGSTMDCLAHWKYTKIYDCPGWRLPTDAEWEYAYRAGITSAYYSGDNTSTNCYNCTTSEVNAAKIAWFCANSQYRTHQVGLMMPNKWGLVGMAGNVWEWVDDWYRAGLGTSTQTDPWNDTAGTYRLLRGGAYDSEPAYLRAAHREYRVGKTWAKNIGLRMARTLP